MAHFWTIFGESINWKSWCFCLKTGVPKMTHFWTPQKMQVVEYLLDPPPRGGSEKGSFQLPECEKSPKMSKMAKMAKMAFFRKFTKNFQKIAKKPEFFNKKWKNVDTSGKITTLIYQKWVKKGYPLLKTTFKWFQKYSVIFQKYRKFTKLFPKNTKKPKIFKNILKYFKNN